MRRPQSAGVIADERGGLLGAELGKGMRCWSEVATVVTEVGDEWEDATSPSASPPQKRRQTLLEWLPSCLSPRAWCTRGVTLPPGR